MFSSISSGRVDKLGDVESIESKVRLIDVLQVIPSWKAMDRCTRRAATALCVFRNLPRYSFAPQRVFHRGDSVVVNFMRV